MSWLRLRANVDSDRAEAVSDALVAQGAVSVSLQPVRGDVAGGVESGPEGWPRVTLTALFAADVDPRTAAALAGLAVCEIDTLPDRDWERAWQQHFRPLRVGGRLWICPRGLAVPESGLPVVYLAAGAAFGTGTHATTALCLERLAAMDLAGCTMIDYGCGSGILAIAALRLGAAYAWGVDIDARALAISGDNAAHNDVADRYRAVSPGGLPADVRGDVVAANILAEPLVLLAPTLSARVRDRGRLLLSGFLTGQLAEVRAAYENDFNLVAFLREGWAVLEGNRRLPPMHRP